MSVLPDTPFDWSAALAKGAVARDEELAPTSLTMAPTAVQARRQSRPAPSGITEAMRDYAAALQRIEPATDHEVSALLRRELGITDPLNARWSLTTINARRNDWLKLDPICIEAVGRERAGRAWRTRWRVRPLSVADRGRR